MKKIVILFIILFMFISSPVEALSYNDNVNNNIHYKLEEKKEDSDSGSSLAFWGMIAVAFLAISVFLIAYKTDDDTYDD